MTVDEARSLRKIIEQASQGLDDKTSLMVVYLHPHWSAGQAYTAGFKAQHDGTLYKCVQAHTSQSDWMPSATPALWVVVSVDEYPEWMQPTGAHDAYNIGDKVTYNGQHYVCTSDGNVYAPNVYGWEEA